MNDDYEHIDENLEYILENILYRESIYNGFNNDDEYRKLNELFNSLLINKCQCSQTALCNLRCIHGGNYILNEESNELVLNSENEKGDLIYECTTMCKCDPKQCLNRLVQYGPRKYLKIIQSTKYKSKGVITTKQIPKGAFICEYAGELLTRHEAGKILRENELKNKMNYVLCLNEMELNDHTMTTNLDDRKSILTIVNPSRKGNIGRYLNHSCQPNCRIFSVRIDCPIPKIAIFSNRVIEAFEELCFHYNEGICSYNSQTMPVNKKRVPCLCGAENCKKYLPNFET